MTPRKQDRILDEYRKYRCIGEPAGGVFISVNGKQLLVDTMVYDLDRYRKAPMKPLWAVPTLGLDGVADDIQT